MTDRPQRRAADQINQADAVEELKTYLDKRLQTGEERMDLFHTELERNTKTCEAMERDVKRTREILQTWDTGKTVVSGVGKVAVWLVSIVATISMAVQAWKGKLW